MDDKREDAAEEAIMFCVLGMGTRSFPTNVHGLIIRKTSSIWQPLHQFTKPYTRRLLYTHTHTNTKYKKKVIITITRCSGNDVVPSPTPGWFVGRQCNLTRIPAAMRHLLYIHTGIRPGRYEIPQSGVNRYRAQGPATAPCSLTSRHNRINLHSLPPSFFFCFFSLNIELSHHLYSTKERERDLAASAFRLRQSFRGKT
jgi:hypothetical protein